MGAYTLENLRYGLDRDDVPRHYDDPLVDYAQETDMKAALETVRDFIRDEYGFRSFLATDIPIPTHEEAVARDDPAAHGMTPATQSKLFAAVSNAVVFLFPYAGLTDGVSTELGGVSEFLELSDELPSEPRKPPERCLVLENARFGSATVDEHRYDCKMTYDEYHYADDIERSLKNFLDYVWDIDQQYDRGEYPVHRLPDDYQFRAYKPEERRNTDIRM